MEAGQVTSTKDMVEYLLDTTKRPGVDKVIEFLNESDFYTAPASGNMKYHNCCAGGLLDHSHKVYMMMFELNERLPIEKRFAKDSIILVGLLHDLCKVNTYQPNILKTTKQLSEDKPYKSEDKFPVGHGEKSVIVLLNLGLKLTDEEIIAIRWHMNAFDNVPYSRSSDSWNDLSILCFIADYFSTRFLELVVKKDEVKCVSI